MIKHFFNYEIVDWESWSRVFRSTKQFYYLVKEIFRIERLAFDEIENCKPGTNGVFKVGNFIVKIFVPKESGYNSAPDYTSELYALKMANQLGVSIPNLLAYGEIRDKYLFRYLIMDYIEGKTLGDIRECLTKKQKQLIGAKLRKIVDK
jgi:predicted Ser/Thr protein kinase